MSFKVTLSYKRRIQLDVDPSHPNYGVIFQVLQEPRKGNEFYYVRREDTGELGFFTAEVLREK